MLEPTEADRRIDPDVEIVAHNLPCLIAIRDACRALDWPGEYLLCAGLLIELATLVEGETPPGSECHRIAAMVMDEERTA